MKIMLFFVLLLVTSPAFYGCSQEALPLPEEEDRITHEMPQTQEDTAKIMTPEEDLPANDSLPLPDQVTQESVEADVDVTTPESPTVTTSLGIIESVTGYGTDIEIVRKDSQVGPNDRILTVDYISYLLRNPPTIQDGVNSYHDFVPMLPVLELLGMPASWLEDEQCYVCHLLGREIKITPTSSTYIVDGVAENWSYAPIYVEDQLLFNLRLLVQFSAYRYNVTSSRVDLSVYTSTASDDRAYDESRRYNFIVNGAAVDFGDTIVIYSAWNDTSYYPYYHVPLKQLIETLGGSYIQDGKMVTCQIGDWQTQIDTSYSGIYGNPQDYGYFTQSQFYDYVYEGELYTSVLALDTIIPQCTVGYHPPTRTYYIDLEPVEDAQRPPLVYYWSYYNHPDYR